MQLEFRKSETATSAAATVSLFSVDEAELFNFSDEVSRKLLQIVIMYHMMI